MRLARHARQSNVRLDLQTNMALNNEWDVDPKSAQRDAHMHWRTESLGIMLKDRLSGAPWSQLIQQARRRPIAFGTATGGSGVEVAILKGVRNVCLEIWLDRYVEEDKWRLWFGFVQRGRGRGVDKLVNLGSALVEPARDRSNEPCVPSKSGSFLRMLDPLEDFEYGRPFADIGGPIKLYGYYARSPADFSKGWQSARIAEALQFLEQLSPAIRQLTIGARALTTTSRHRERVGVTAGYERDPLVRRAIEDRAMQTAMAFYKSRGYTVNDVHANRSYDLHCTRKAQCLRVEVKGTRTGECTIDLTAGERAIFERHGRGAELYILHSVACGSKDGKHVASGGVRRLFSASAVANGEFKPTRFQWKPKV
jgi:hypothetical protein